MKYRIGQAVWVMFSNGAASGWQAGTVVGYSIARLGKYLVDVPTVPFTKDYMPSDSEGYWRPEETGLKPRDPPQQDWVKLCNLTDVPREVEHV